MGLFVCSAVLLWGAQSVAAPVMLPEAQQSRFQSVAHVAENAYAVPTMIDVHVPIDIYGPSDVAVTDGTGALLPSALSTTTQLQRVPVSATATPAIADVRNLTDGNYETFADFPFTESPDHLPREHHATIDLTAHTPITTDTLRIFTDTYSATPARVRVVAVRPDGTEHIALPLRFLGRAPINFPEETAAHFRIDITYTGPLRITEIVLQDKNDTAIQETAVRFIATPKQQHHIYFNPQGAVKLPPQEQPNFVTRNAVPLVAAVSVESNMAFGRADTDGDGVLDSDDNCPFVVNAAQEDANANGIGDACEDFDADGVINAQDNCPLVANRTQSDTDGDGIGDACDDEESRFFEKRPWVVYAVILVVSIIVLAIIARVLTSQTPPDVKM